MLNKDIFLSAIIPAYNEENYIVNTLKVISAKLDEIDLPYEIIVVNDGSTDLTLKHVKGFWRQAHFPLQLIEHKKNRGKGAALKTGILKSEGKYIFYTDVDLSVSMEMLDKFLKKLEEGYDVVIGSRKIKGAFVKKHQPYIREFLGKGYTYLSNLILNSNFSDFTCGLKAFRGKAARKLFSNLKVLNWSFDAEILYLTKKYKYKFCEVPVLWYNNPDTKVRLIRDIISSFIGLLKVRLNEIKNIYESDKL